MLDTHQEPHSLLRASHPRSRDYKNATAVLVLRVLAAQRSCQRAFLVCLLPPWCQKLATLLPLQGPGNLSKSALICRPPEGAYGHFIFRHHPQLWATGLSRVFCPLHGARGVWPGCSGKLFSSVPQRPRARRDGWEGTKGWALT